LRAAAFLSTFDRFTIAPMLVTIAAALGVSLEEVAVAASVYYLLYGLMQPVWGMLSDRLGRVRVMRLALLAVLLPGLISAVAPSLAVLVAGGFAFMHSTLQTWATEVLPEARATVVSFFASSVFAGSGVATAVAAPLAEAGSFGPLFSIAALTAVPLRLVGSVARLSYDRSSR
jgi:MFS family permease